jgi:hypothetical protein
VILFPGVFCYFLFDYFCIFLCADWSLVFFSREFTTVNYAGKWFISELQEPRNNTAL